MTVACQVTLDGQGVQVCSGPGEMAGQCMYARATFLHHVRAREHPAGLLVAPPARQLDVDHRVLDRGVAHPVLHEAQVRPRVQEVGGDRVLEHVEVPF